MALSRTNLLGVESPVPTGNFGTGNFTTASFTPPSNSLLVVAMELIENNGTTTDPTAGSVMTISGGGWTYTARTSAVAAPTSFPTAVKIFTAPVGTGASMTLTVGTGGRTIGEYAVSVVAYTGYDTVTPTGATGSNSQNGGFAGPPTPFSLTLSGAPASTSEVFAAVGMDKSVANASPGSTFTEIDDVENTDWGGLESEIRTGSTSTTVDWVDLRAGGGALFNAAACAVEIRADLGAVNVGSVSQSFHPGRGPNNRARFYQTPRSTDPAPTGSTVTADAVETTTATITATATEVANASATETTTATIAATATEVANAAATVPTTATIAAGAVETANAQTTVTTTATITANAAATHPVDTTRPTTATITASAVEVANAQAAVATTVTITASANVGAAPVSIDATVPETVTITAAGAAIHPVDATRPTTVTITSTATQAANAQATRATTAAVVAAATEIARAAATIPTTVAILATANVAAAFTPAYVSIDGAGSTGGLDGAQTAQTTDGAGSSTNLDSAANTGAQEGATTAAGYV